MCVVEQLHNFVLVCECVFVNDRGLRFGLNTRINVSALRLLFDFFIIAAFFFVCLFTLKSVTRRRRALVGFAYHRFLYFL